MCQTCSTSLQSLTVLPSRGSQAGWLVVVVVVVVEEGSRLLVSPVLTIFLCGGCAVCCVLRLCEEEW